MDFTLKKYEKILKTINSLETPVFTVWKWIDSCPEHGIILRHDVDRKPGNSLNMAKMEYKYNIKSTYYFRTQKEAFKPSIIKQIENMGHEIGYHYEDLAMAKGNINIAKNLLTKNLNKIKKYADIKTISMHGSPLSKYDNREIWKYLKIENFNIQAEAILDIDYSDIFYLTDTGRSWSNSAPNIRDKTNSKKTNVVTTDDLILFINKNEDKKTALVVHPERWSHTILGFIYSFVFDITANSVKKIIKLVY